MTDGIPPPDLPSPPLAKEQILKVKRIYTTCPVVPASCQSERTKHPSFPLLFPFREDNTSPMVMNKEGHGPGQGGANTCLSMGSSSPLITEPFLLAGRPVACLFLLRDRRYHITPECCCVSSHLWLESATLNDQMSLRFVSHHAVLAGSTVNSHTAGELSDGDILLGEHFRGGK